MSHITSIEQASEKLIELVHKLGPDDEIVLTENDQPIARIVPNALLSKRQFGAWKGMLEILDDSDDVILEHFKDYIA